MTTNQLVRETAPWVERLARLGYASVGVVYIIIGFLSATAAVGRRGGGASDQHDALATIQQQPFGRPALFLIALGLAGYALWRFISGINDSERRGSDAKGWAIRIGSIFRGLLYAGFCLQVIRMLRGAGGSGGGDKTRYWTATVMDKPFGRWAIGLAGLGVIGYGIYQLWKAWKAKLSKQLRISGLSAGAHRAVIAVSRFGLGARGVVFGVIGTSLLRAALHHDPSAAEGTGGALRELSGSLGRWPLAIIGIGLAAYGVYALINARYRIIRTT